MCEREFSEKKMATLIYFPVRGRGESIRMLLTDNDIPYEEVNAGPWENWQNNWKPKMAFGQCPMLKDDGLELVQSNAILRYLGRKYNLYGADNKEATFVDMINDGVEDVRIGYTRMIYQNYEEGKEPYIKELSGKLQPFENLLKSKNGFILGEKISWADYNLFDLLDIHSILSPGCLDAFPTLKAYCQKMLSRPGVQKRRQTDAFKNLPVNGNGKQ